MDSRLSPRGVLPEITARALMAETADEQSTILAEIEAGEVQIVYTTPEKLSASHSSPASRHANGRKAVVNE